VQAAKVRPAKVRPDQDRQIQAMEARHQLIQSQIYQRYLELDKAFWLLRKLAVYLSSASFLGLIKSAWLDTTSKDQEFSWTL